MSKENITTKWRFDASEVLSGIKAASNAIKLNKAEFDAAASGMENWEDNVEGVSLKLKSLGSILSQQKAILQAYKTQMEGHRKAEKDAAAEADRLTKALSELEAKGISKNSKQYRELKSQLTAVTKAQASSAAAADRAELSMLKQQSAVNKTEQEIRSYTARLDEMGDKLDEVEVKSEKASGGFTVLKGALANLVADGFRMAIAAAGDFIKQIGKVGMTFDSAMSEVKAISGATADQMEKLRQKAKDMGATTKFSAAESADALKYMAMAGWDTNSMLDGLEGIMNLAAASGEDLGKTSDIITDGLTAFGLAAKDSGHFADVMAAASSSANTNVSLLGESFKEVAALAGTMDYSIDDVATTLGIMANAGIKGGKAGTALKNTIANMSAPTKAMQEIMDKYNLSLTNSDGTMKELSEVIDDLRKAFGGLSQDEQAAAASALFGKESMAGMLSVITASEADYKKLADAVASADGAAKNMADTMTDNLGGDLVKMNSHLEAVQLNLYEKVEPALRDVVKIGDKFIDFLQWVVDHGDGIITILSGMAAAAVAYATVVTVSKVAKDGLMSLEIAQKAVTAAQWLMNAAMNANPLGLIAALIVGVVVALMTLWNKSEEFRTFWNNLWGGIGDFIGTTVDNITGFFKELPGKLIDIGKEMIDGLIKGITSAPGKIGKAIGDVGNNIVNGFKSFFGIHSPSRRIADEVGEPIGEAIPTGMERAKSKTMQTINRMSSGIMDKAKSMLVDVKGSLSGVSLGSSPAFAGVSGSGQVVNNYYQTVTQNNTSPKALDRRELRKDTEKLARELKRVKS